MSINDDKNHENANNYYLICNKVISGFSLILQKLFLLKLVLFVGFVEKGPSLKKVTLPL